MYLKLKILFFILNLFVVQSTIYNNILKNIFEINNGFRRLVKEIQKISTLTGATILTRWIEQDLDHFDENETRTWKMRYFERLEFWRPNGPVYLFISGESPADKGFLTTGVMYDLANETKGAMFVSEHRYYGESQPVNKSTNIEDLKFLSASQALADNAVLLKAIKKNILFKNSKIVVIGGSYAGNLAAWMRLVYPDLVDAAIASSGPVEAKRDFYEYLEIVNRDYDQYGSPGCLENIRSMFQRYDSLFNSSKGIKQLKDEENICNKTDMTKSENKQLFFMTKASNFMSTAQYGTVDKIKNHCSKINKTKDMYVQDDNEQKNGTEYCVDYDFYSVLKAYYEEENDDTLCWTYQTCTEFGFFQSTTSDKQPFTSNIPVEIYDKMCIGLFGESFNKERVNKGVKKTNKLYGGKSPNVTQVVFVNGNLDPWSALGVLEDISYNAPAIYIPRSSHCGDLYSNVKNDPEELKESRKNIKYLIKKWISADDFSLFNISL